MNSKYSILIICCMLLAMVACSKIDLTEFEKDKEKEENTTITGDEQQPQSPPYDIQPTHSLLSNGHIILTADCIETNTWRVLYVSLNEWQKIPSANAAEPSERDSAMTIARSYNENDMTGWRMPTTNEAREIRKLYYSYNDGYEDLLCDTLIRLNERITNADGIALRAWEAKSSHPAHRYLCEDATYSFSLKGNSNVTVTGAKTTYNLRLIKDTTITIN